MPAPISPATENDVLTIALIAVMAAHIQNALGVFSLLSIVCLKGRTGIIADLVKPSWL